ncbi:unnamed protein product [Mytilus edulis]|uniref:Novel STAND NTPase 3 domain-containing protein n=1 Tax=Mytilus edulis TaxID=6550 RepID=A0A8S3SMS7_MYTED|nr:unnamed protein product [Mytilus edulis]
MSLSNLKRNGYTILTVIDAKQIKEYYKSERKTMYIVDDVCGNFTANQARLDEWKKSKTDIEEILQSGNCKLVLTCRLQVFQDQGFENLKTFKTCICNITSTDLSLTYEEKEQMTTEYFGEHAIKALAQLVKYDFLPLLCKLYLVLRNDRQFKLEKFLNEPFSFYEEDLTCMKNDCKEGKYKYCALLLLVLFNNKLEEKHLTGKDPKVEKIIEDIIKNV